MGRLVRGQGHVVASAVLDAHAQAREILKTARREGLETGRQEALAEATALLVAARADADKLRKGGRATALRLAVRIAEKIVGRAVELEPRLLADLADQALAASHARAGAIRLRVHPDDLAIVTRERPRLVRRLAEGAELRIEADASVGRAGCVVETPIGRLDARLETQLAAIEHALAESEGDHD